MFYTRITTRCNMTCGHCGFACGAQGEDMSMETYLNVLKLHVSTKQDTVQLGGGEPTVHPQFWEMLDKAVKCCKYELPNYKDPYAWLCTNGKKTEDTLRLIDMALGGDLSLSLSLDEWHDPIDQRIVDMFEQYDNPFETLFGSPRLSIKRARAYTLAKTGRAKNIEGAETRCLCNTMIIQPNGDVSICGCEDAPVVGNVNSNFQIPGYWYEGYCCSLINQY